MLDVKALGAEIGAIVIEIVSPIQKESAILRGEIVQLRDEIAQLKAIRPEKGEKGDQGPRGEIGPQGPAGDIGPHGAVGAIGPQGEQGLSGAQGIQGNCGDTGPAGARGMDGAPGASGAPGKDADPIDVRDVVRELAACDEIVPILSLLVADSLTKHFAANPIKDGRDGKDGLPGTKGEKGDVGLAGKDGRGVAGALIDRDGVLALTMSDGAVEKLGPVVGKDGKDGLKGEDGLSVESLDREYLPDTHEIVERWTAAGKTKELRYPAGGIRDAGYWREGMRARAGEAMTHDGTLWIALRDTNAKPCTENKADWRIGARKGRDGIDGRNGRDLGPAPPVKLGTSNA